MGVLIAVNTQRAGLLSGLVLLVSKELASADGTETKTTKVESPMTPYLLPHSLAFVCFWGNFHFCFFVWVNNYVRNQSYPKA